MGWCIIDTKLSSKQQKYRDSEAKQRTFSRVKLGFEQEFSMLQSSVDEPS